MPSTYTTNLGIEKIATGEQSGTWGTTTNTNLDLIDEAVNGIVTVTLAGAGSSGSPNTLAISNGASSDGRNKYIEFNDGGDLGGTAYVQLTPNDAEKIVHIRNSLSASRSILIFQGTYNASNDFEIPNGADVVLKFDGAGAGAVVSDVNVNLTPTKLTTADLVATTADINGGSVDGATLGTNSAITEAQVDNININGNTISTTNTNGDLTITPNGSGDFIISSGNVGIGTSSPLSTANITTLQVKGTNTSRLILETDTNSRQRGWYVGSGNELAAYDWSASSELMRIDSSGNLLVGTANANTNTGGNGVRCKADGTLQSRSDYPADLIKNGFGDVLRFSYASSEGVAASIAGSIGTNGTDPYIGRNNVGLFFGGGDDFILPFNPSTIASRDNAIDLGRSVTRFKDLYLSGGAYIGGTTSANFLDDYEEGTWTPTYSFDGGGTVTNTANNGKYVKIGSLVQASFRIRSTGVSGVSGNLQINGLPFTISSEERSGGSPSFMRGWGADMPNFRLYPVQNTTYIVMYFNATNASASQVDTTEFSTGADNNVLEAHVIYQV